MVFSDHTHLLFLLLFKKMDKWRIKLMNMKSKPTIINLMWGHDANSTFSESYHSYLKAINMQIKTKL